MIKREVIMPAELIVDITRIVHEEGYTVLQDAFPEVKVSPPVFLSQAEAEALITLVVIEKKKAWLKYPHYDDEDPEYNEEHEAKFDDIQMGIYEKTLYYVESAFKKGSFSSLI